MCILKDDIGDQSKKKKTKASLTNKFVKIKRTHHWLLAPISKAYYSPYNERLELSSSVHLPKILERQFPRHRQMFLKLYLNLNLNHCCLWKLTSSVLVLPAVDNIAALRVSVQAKWWPLPKQWRLQICSVRKVKSKVKLKKKNYLAIKNNLG